MTDVPRRASGLTGSECAVPNAAGPGLMAGQRSIRLVLADDHTVFREGLRSLLEHEPDFVVVGEAGDGAAAIHLAETMRPDVLLLDVSMPTCTGFGVLKALESSSLPCRVLLLTAEIEPAGILEALQLGASGVVAKTSAIALVKKAIRSVMAGQHWVGRDTTADLIRSLRDSKDRRPSTRGRFGLTARELQILSEIVAGSTNRDIAEHFGLSRETVKHHLANMFDKAGVSSRVELALFAVNHHLVDEAI